MSGPRWSSTDLPVDDRVARAVLLRAVEPATRAMLDLLDSAGPCEAVAAIVDRRPIGDCDVEGMRQRIWPGCGEADIAAAAAVGARLVIPGDAEWPSSLDDLERLRLTSLGVWARGEGLLAAAVQRSVSIVGTRAASDYGGWVARELAGGLAVRGWCVVSGLAFGIDAAAHGGALNVGARGGGTVAVLAGGIDSPYPKAHAGLMRRIMADGVVVSEHPPGSAPHKARFLVRNRMIAALSAGTVVVEAAARSGARTTARYAGALGRHVMAVPGRITSQESIGCHQLLRDDPGVALITCVEDIIEMVGALGEFAPRASGQPRARDHLEPMLARVLDCMPVRYPVTAERIAVSAGVNVGRVVQSLDRLQADQFVEQVDGGWRLTLLERERRRDVAKGRAALDLDW